MPFAYILFSEKLDKYYIGSCIDPDRRIYEHNIGHSKFTSLGIPWKLAYVEEYETTKLARDREIQIKRRKSRNYIIELIANGRASRF